MAVSTVKAVFKCDVKTVWDIVTDLGNYAWRSDVSEIEVISDARFRERSKDGFVTEFTVTLTERHKRWEFDIDNENISGHWSGIFSQSGELTTIEFTENITAKKALMKPFVKGFLKRQQALYIGDLKKELERLSENVR